MASQHKLLVVTGLALVSCLWSTTCAESKSKAYIIHMDKAAMPKAFSTHQSWFHSTLASISESSETPLTVSKLIHTYTNSMHGFSATLTSSELETLKSFPGYLHSTPDRKMNLFTTHTPKFLGLNPNSGIWPASSFGSGIVIGVIDTGIWPESASFRDDGMRDPPTKWKGTCQGGDGFNPSLCNKKFIGARFFNKGLHANNPDSLDGLNSTRDENGHGTHTPSTAAGASVEGASYFGYATGTAVGVAPGAHVAAYKCSWENGFYTSDFLAAVDWAIADGVDVLSVSLGISYGANSLEDDAMAVASFAAAEKGVFVSAAAGNGGPFPGTVINGSPWITTVAAGTVDRLFRGALILRNDIEIGFDSLYAGNSSSDYSPLVYLDTCGDPKRVKKLKTKIIVCDDKYANTWSEILAGVIFITNESLSDDFTTSPTPTAFIGLKDGQTVIDYIKNSRNPRARFEFKKTVIGGTPAPTVAEYSSRGPFLGCSSVLKPDILAPGSFILASWLPTSPIAEVGNCSLFGSFNIDSGTSTATPHVAGVAALVMSSHPDWSPAAVRSALITTANPLDNAGNAIEDAAGSGIPGLDGGAGHVDPNKAVDPGLVYDARTEDYVSFLCGLNYTAKQIRIITKSDHACTYQSNSDLNYPSFIAYFNGVGDGRIVREFRRTLTNVGKARSSYMARLTAMRELRVKVDPTKLVFNKKYEKLSYKLTLEGPRVLKVSSVLGSLSWVEESGKYVVRSPIVATSIDPKSLQE